MKIDRDKHPVCITAVRIMLVCFGGFVALALMDATREHTKRSPAFYAAIAVLTFLSCCAIVTYIRPRGIFAYITSTAFVGVVAAGGLFLDSSHLNLHGPWGTVLAAILFSAWLWRGIRMAIESHREGQSE